MFPGELAVIIFWVVSFVLWSYTRYFSDNKAARGPLPTRWPLVGMLSSHFRDKKATRGVIPTRWPLVGMLPSILINTHRLYDWITDILATSQGNFQFYGPKFSRLNYFFTADPANLEYVLKDNFANFIKGQDAMDIFHEILGQGIINTDGDAWHLQRKVTSLQLHSGSHRRFSDAAIISAVENKLIPVLKQLSTRGVDVDFQELMHSFTFDTMCHVGFGVEVGCLTPELPEVPFAKAFEEAAACVMDRFFLPPTCWKLIRWLKIGKERRMPAAMQVMNDFVSKAISDRRKNLAAAPDENSDYNDLLSCFMKLKSDDDKVLRDVCLNFLIAGSDTTASSLTWLFWLLDTHPDKEEKVLEEISREMELANGRLSREVLNRMNYLHAAINESLRLYPIVPLDIRHIVSDDVLPDGRRVYRDHKVVYSVYSMGRMESIWGADCREFRPERWLSATNPGEIIHVSPFRFPVFNGGPRTCIGKDMAYMVMKAVVCRVLQCFKLKMLPGHVVEPKIAPTSSMKHGLLVTLHTRNCTASPPMVL